MQSFNSKTFQWNVRISLASAGFIITLFSANISRLVFVDISEMFQASQLASKHTN